jgi:hypothetical protein
MFFVYGFDLIVKVWFVFIVLTLEVDVFGDFLERFSWFQFMYLFVYVICLSVT